MNLSRRLAAASFLAAAVLGGAALIVRPPLQGAHAAEPTERATTTVPVETRTLAATETLSGTLGYTGSATLTDRLVTSGTTDVRSLADAVASATAAYHAAVAARDSLLHPSSDRVTSARAQLAQAAAALETARTSTGGPTAEQIAQARQQVAQAEANLLGVQEAARGPSPAEIATATARLSAARAELIAAQEAAKGPSAAALTQARNAVTAAQLQLSSDTTVAQDAAAALASCQANPPVAGCSAERQQVDRLSMQLLQDQTALTTAEANLEELTSPRNTAAAQARVESAEAAVKSAQAALDELTATGESPASQAQLASATAGLEAARAALDALQAGGNTKTARAQLQSAAASVSTASAALEALLNPSTADRRQAADAVVLARNQLETAEARLGQPRGVVTWLPEVGSVVERGGSLFAFDGGVPTVLMYGSTPAWRDMAVGIPDGIDVRQLEENLVALGVADASLEVDQHWDEATSAAVIAWQKKLGVPADGSVRLGSIEFHPSAVRVTARRVSLGDTLQQGNPVLDVTSTSKLVSVALPAARQGSVAVGDAVFIRLPDGGSTGGHVAEISRVATTGSGSSATFAVKVALDDASATGDLDQAPVTVRITTDTRSNVLAVPVNALVALLEGGYAIELDRSGEQAFVRVEIGLFADGYVEVSGEGIAAGDLVVVPR